MNGVPWWFFEGFGGRYAGTRLKSVDADGSIAQAVPARHIIGCVVHASFSLDGPGQVRLGHQVARQDPGDGLVNGSVDRLLGDARSIGHRVMVRPRPAAIYAL